MNATQQLREKATSYGLHSMTDAELCKIARLPEDYTKSLQFKAAKELSRREAANQTERQQFKDSSTAAKFFNFLTDLDHEEFHVLYLNRKNRLLFTQMIGKGNCTSTVVNTKEILKQACEIKACAVILAHNHPSGDTTPSQADKDITNRMRDALRLVDIQLIDHVIVAANTQYHYSFADEGQL